MTIVRDGLRDATAVPNAHSECAAPEPLHGHVPASDIGRARLRDIDLALRGRRNVLITGQFHQCERILALIGPAFELPITRWHTGERLTLRPASMVATLVLHEVGELDRFDQIRLHGWLDAARTVRIISLSTTPLIDRVNQGKFLEDLYYRLNTIHIEA